LGVTASYAWDDAPALLAACEETGMEGVVLKRLDSPYLPGKRTDAWRKVKCAAWAEYGHQRFRPSLHTPCHLHGSGGAGETWT
jgi:ATP-dependent DNA ligase